MKMKITSLFLMLVLLFSFSGNSANAEVISEDITNKKENVGFFGEDYIGYQYPILPGTDKWPYGNHQLMVDACQIPKEVVSNMTTEELAATILAYPLNIDMYAYDNFEMGFSIVKEHFNGLQEFCTRTDCKTAHCGRRERQIDFGKSVSLTAQPIGKPQAHGGITADCRGFVSETDRLPVSEIRP